jgi:hypothetical protein
LPCPFNPLHKAVGGKTFLPLEESQALKRANILLRALGILLLFLGDARTLPRVGAQALEKQIYLQVDKESAKQLANARRCLDAGQWEEAVKLLQTILDNKNDAFVKSTTQLDKLTGSPKWATARSEANHLIATSSEKCRLEYDRLYGLAAAQMLRRALRTEPADEKILNDLTNRYLHTEAGARAAALLGSQYTDREEPGLALISFRRLVEHSRLPALPSSDLYRGMRCFMEFGDRKNAQVLWEKLKVRASNGRLTIGSMTLRVEEVESELLRIKP